MPALRAVDPAEGGDATPSAIDELRGTWPHELSHDAHLRVSDVLAQLGGEFPALTPSKLRFLDNNGLVSPERTAAGYRQYSPADLERLRYVLRQQRDHFTPLSVIADHLESLDRGRTHLAVTPHGVEDRASLLSAPELAGAAGTTTDVVATLESHGVISQSVPDRFERTVLPLVVASRAYLEAGGDPRSLRVLVRAAARESELIEDASAPARRRGRDSEADAADSSRAEAAVAVFSACVHGRIGR